MDKLSVFEPVEGVKFIALEEDLKEYVSKLAENFKKYLEVPKEIKEEKKVEKQKESVPNDFNGFLRYVARVYFDGDLKFTKKFFNALRNINPVIAFALGSWILAKLIDKKYETNVLNEEDAFLVCCGRKNQEDIFGCVRTKEEAYKIVNILSPIAEFANNVQSKNKECQK